MRRTGTCRTNSGAELLRKIETLEHQQRPLTAFDSDGFNSYRKFMAMMPRLPFEQNHLLHICAV